MAADNTKIFLGLTTAISSVAAVYLGVKHYQYKTALKEFHDNYNKAGTGTIPAGLIPQWFLEEMNKIK